MRRRTWYDLLAGGTLAVAGVAGVLAVAGAALQQALSAGAAALCALLFFIPGAYLLAYATRLRSRELALAHAAAFANAHGTLDVNDLATELAVPRDDAEKILRTAVREGHLRGRFDEHGRFVVDSTTAKPEGPWP